MQGVLINDVYDFFILVLKNKKILSNLERISIKIFVASKWCRLRDSNLQPIAYEAIALPLSQVGAHII